MLDKKAVKYTKYGIEQTNITTGEKDLLTSNSLTHQCRYTKSSTKRYEGKNNSKAIPIGDVNAAISRFNTATVSDNVAGFEAIHGGATIAKATAKTVMGTVHAVKGLREFKNATAFQKYKLIKGGVKNIGTGTAMKFGNKYADVISTVGKQSDDSGIAAIASIPGIAMRSAQTALNAIEAVKKINKVAAQINAVINFLKGILSKILAGSSGAVLPVIVIVIMVGIVSSMFGGTSAENAPKDTVEYIERLDKAFIEQVKLESEAMGDLQIIGLERVTTSVDDMLALLFAVNDGDVDLTSGSKELMSNWHAELNVYTFETIEKEVTNEDGETETQSYSVIIVDTFTVQQKVLSFGLNNDQTEMLNAIFEVRQEINVGDGTFAHPLKGYTYITSPYGQRIDPISGEITEFHTGIDISAPTGVPIYPIAPGVVTYSGSRGTYGNLVIIQHTNGMESYYAHCDTLNVSVGEKVTASTQIATVGETGRVTGPHLHLEMRVGGRHTDPVSYLKR